MTDDAIKVVSSEPNNRGTEPPPGWGTDELTNFFDIARNNQWATFWNKRSIATKLIAVDAQFVKATENWLNPRCETEALLLLRCHAAFRAAASLAMAGQAPEAFVQSRAMLEFAAYAVHIHRDPSLSEVWLNRHQDQSSMEVQKNAFSHRRVSDSVAAGNLHAGQRFEDLYQRTIDYGGHPNERSVTGNLKMIDDADRRTVLSIMLHKDGPQLDHALKSVAQCGLVSLEMLQIVFNARFEILGINAAMYELRKGM